VKQLPPIPTALEQISPIQVVPAQAPAAEPAAVVGEALRPTSSYLRILYRRRWLALGVFILIVAAAAMLLLTTTPIYEGRTALLIEVTDPKVVTFSQILDQNPLSNDFYQTQYELLKSRTLARQTVEGLGLASNPAFVKAGRAASAGSGDSSDSAMPSLLTRGLDRAQSLVGSVIGSAPAKPLPTSIDPVDLATDVLTRNLSVEPLKNSRIVEIRFKTSDPQLAALVPNTLARNYINLTLNFKLQTAKDASRWLDQQLAEQRKAVEAGEEAVQRYREKHNALSLGEKQNAVRAQKLIDLNSAVARARASRIEKQALYEQAKSIGTNGEGLEAFPPVLANPVIQRIKSELADQQRQQSQLAQKLGDRHPEMLTLKSTIEATQAKLRAEIGKVVESIRTDYLAAVAQETSLMSELRGQEVQSMALDRTAIEFGVLEREAESARQLFQSLLQRAKELDVSSELKTTNVRVVDEAGIPTKPISPDLPRGLGISVAVGLVLAVGLAFGLEHFDQRVKSPDDIIFRLGQPFLVLIPKFSARKVKGRIPLFGRMSPPGLLEAFGDLRTSVLLSTDAEPLKLLVTSAGPGEGKTLVAVNLAVSLARAGRRVLLIDVDLRRPAVHTAFDQPEKPGLTDLLNGTAPMSQVLRPTNVAGLMFLPAGDVVDDPTALLASLDLTTFIRNSGRHFDCIVFDTPPLMAVADATQLSRAVDGAIFVVNAQGTARRSAALALTRLEESGARVLGVVLNRADIARHGFYYHPYYRREYTAYYTTPKRS
jgi:capsular exopolysaccharide synthesis family protein